MSLLFNFQSPMKPKLNVEQVIIYMKFIVLGLATGFALGWFAQKTLIGSESQRLEIKNQLDRRNSLSSTLPGDLKDVSTSELLRVNLIESENKRLAQENLRLSETIESLQHDAKRASTDLEALLTGPNSAIESKLRTYVELRGKVPDQFKEVVSLADEDEGLNIIDFHNQQAGEAIWEREMEQNFQNFFYVNVDPTVVELTRVTCKNFSCELLLTTDNRIDGDGTIYTGFSDKLNQQPWLTYSNSYGYSSREGNKNFKYFLFLDFTDAYSEAE